NSSVNVLTDINTPSLGLHYEAKKCLRNPGLFSVPFEVLSITVSLISRILFEYGYYYKVMRTKANEQINNDAPLLLVYEEAHKYVPKSDLARFRASKFSIERIAKEGRKYGVTLLLSSQRPSEISETIFSQCSNFLAMRLTNPSDQSYVSRLLPDTLGNLCEKLPTLGAGEALLIGEAVVMPSLIKVKPCSPTPSSTDIPYFQLWKEEWKDLDFVGIKKTWLKE
ncbi:ATP-binding protein, partial [Serratia proteamaculans]|uniref:ATP-binding protein n=1 Tax=Serratia proteamaculans TaxID=28151 RepID=UPI0021C83A76